MKSDVGRFAIIPEWLLDAGVSGDAVRIFAVLSIRFNALGTPSLETIAAASGDSIITVNSAIHELYACDALQDFLARNLAIGGAEDEH